MLMAKPGAIEIARGAKGWTKSDLSEKSGICRSSITTIETRKRSANPKSAKKISEILDCEIDDLFESE